MILTVDTNSYLVNIIDSKAESIFLNNTNIKGDLQTMETNVQPVTECNAEVRVRPETLCVRSMQIAKALCVDYPFWDDLLAIKQDKFNLTKNWRVWIFKKTPELFEAFLEIVEGRKVARESKMEEIEE